MARPIPRVPPVTRQTLFSRDSCCFMLLGYGPGTGRSLSGSWPGT